MGVGCGKEEDVEGGGASYARLVELHSVQQRGGIVPVWCHLCLYAGDGGEREEANEWA